MSKQIFQEEVADGQRFEFGKNWQRFLSLLNDQRIAEAERSLQVMLDTTTLEGKTFLDVGCGSGLFSLAAMRLGALRIHSFDYDPLSVACATELKRRYFRNVAHWKIEQGSALDVAYLNSLGQWDYVYSWGVLHHTGNMWSALKNMPALVKREGVLFISIYNDQGNLSKFWRMVKKLYNKGSFTRWLISVIFVPYFLTRSVAVEVLRRMKLIPGRSSRGMSRFYDMFDWLGGYPFEVAKPEEIFYFYRQFGFSLERLKTVGGRLGCNEFVFRKQ